MTPSAQGPSSSPVPEGFGGNGDRARVKGLQASWPIRSRLERTPRSGPRPWPAGGANTSFPSWFFSQEILLNLSLLPAVPCSASGRPQHFGGEKNAARFRLSRLRLEASGSERAVSSTKEARPPGSAGRSVRRSGGHPPRSVPGSFRSEKGVEAGDIPAAGRRFPNRTGPGSTGPARKCAHRGLFPSPTSEPTGFPVVEGLPNMPISSSLIWKTSPKSRPMSSRPRIALCPAPAKRAPAASGSE